MRMSLFLKLFISYVSVLVVFPCLIIFTTLQTVKPYYLDFLKDSLNKTGVALSLPFSELLAKRDFIKVDSLAKLMGKRLQVRITIVDLNGIVLADSEKDPSAMENHLTRTEILQAIKNGLGVSLRYSDTVKKEMLYVASPLYLNEGNMLGVIRVSLFLKDIDVLLDKLNKNIMLISLVIVLIGMIGVYLLSRKLSLPIKALSLAAAHVASGNFKSRVYLDSHDELRDFADSFNQMTEQLNDSFTKISKQKGELSSLIESIYEGIFVIDDQERIKMGNQAFKKLVGIDQVENKKYWEVLNDYEFTELFRQVTADKNVSKELNLRGKQLLVSITPIAITAEKIITLHDLSEIEKFEKLKRDLVTNVSHELKTPLTAILGFSETLEDVLFGKEKRYAEIIKKNTKRLISIVGELLILSELEDKSAVFDYQTIDVQAILNEVVALFKQKFENKQIKLVFDCQADDLKSVGSAFKIEQVFINLLDNALKYTDKGMVDIMVTKDEKWLKVSFKDTGIGIAADKIDKVFERFYVVDKSRSRVSSGTGLGLSIVKHIVALHNGKIEVSSTLHVGSEFVVFLPLI